MPKRRFGAGVPETIRVECVCCRPESTLSQLQEGTAAKFETKLVGQFEDHNSQVWRVSWNILGTILASSGDDGCVRLWKGDPLVPPNTSGRRVQKSLYISALFTNEPTFS